MSFLPASFSRLFSKHPILIPAATAGILVFAIPSIEFICLHRRLDKSIINFYSNGPYAKNVARSSPDAYLPPSVQVRPDDFRIHYDVATKAIQKSLLPSTDYNEMLTTYLRHNMSLFSRLPQAYLLWLTASTQDRQSFSIEHISGLDFQPEDIVCAAYRVLSREDGLCVFAMAQGPIEGRLVISIQDETSTLDDITGNWVALPEIKAEGETSELQRATFKNQTFMWVSKDEGVVMPMERSLARYLHEVTAWWLMQSGTEWLQKMPNPNN